MEKKKKTILKYTNILIVDDDINVRKQLKDFLSLYVNDIYEANDGEEALSLYHVYHPTLIFSDVKMPKMDGIELVKNIRKINQQIPIVLLSAYHETNILLEAIQLGLVEYLVKPISIQNLRKLLTKLSDIIESKDLLIIHLSKNNYFNIKEKKIYRDDDSFLLTKNEEKLLKLFLENEGKILEEEFLINTIWDYEHKTISALRNLIARMRVKIGKHYITSISGYGYKFQR